MPLATSCSPRWAIGLRNAARSRMSVSAVNKQQGVDLDGAAEWKAGDADGDARVSAFLSQDLHHQIGGAVEHLRVLNEVGRGVDVARQPHNLRDPVKAAERRFRLGENVQRAQ